MVWARKETLRETPVADAAESAEPETDAASVDYPIQQSLVAIAAVATAVASAFWLPAKFEVGRVVAGIVGAGFGIVVATLIVALYTYCRMQFGARAPAASPAEGMLICDDPDLKEYFTEEKQRELRERSDASFMADFDDQDKAWQQVTATAEYKSMTEEQQEVKAKQFYADWMPRSEEERALAGADEPALDVEEPPASPGSEAQPGAQNEAERLADEKRLSDMEKTAQAGGYTDQKLLAEIQTLRLRLFSNQRSDGG